MRPYEQHLDEILPKPPPAWPPHLGECTPGLVSCRVFPGTGYTLRGDSELLYQVQQGTVAASSTIDCCCCVAVHRSRADRVAAYAMTGSVCARLDSINEWWDSGACRVLEVMKRPTSDLRALVAVCSAAAAYERVYCCACCCCCTACRIIIETLARSTSDLVRALSACHMSASPAAAVERSCPCALYRCRLRTSTTLLLLYEQVHAAAVIVVVLAFIYLYGGTGDRRKTRNLHSVYLYLVVDFYIRWAACCLLCKRQRDKGTSTSHISGSTLHTCGKRHSEAKRTLQLLQQILFELVL